jgi:pimeloyl-ACP methyl ester carboxylesterase
LADPNSKPNATYVLVHGGGHGGWCWARLGVLLRAAGHEVHTPTMTGLGERMHMLNPDIGLDTHITDIVNVLRYEDLRNVILVGHSYGGVIITGVADRALDRVGQLVYLDAAIPMNGESVADVSPAVRDIARNTMRTVNGTELFLWPDDAITRDIYGVPDPGDWAWMEKKLTPHPWRTFTQPLVLENESAVMRIARTIVNCSSTLERRRAELGGRYFTADRVWEIDTGHDLMITEPHAVAEMLLKLAAL